MSLLKLFNLSGKPKKELLQPKMNVARDVLAEAFAGEKFVPNIISKVLQTAEISDANFFQSAFLPAKLWIDGVLCDYITISLEKEMGLIHFLSGEAYILDERAGNGNSFSLVRIRQQIKIEKEGGGVVYTSRKCTTGGSVRKSGLGVENIPDVVDSFSLIETTTLDKGNYRIYLYKQLDAPLYDGTYLAYLLMAELTIMTLKR